MVASHKQSENSEQGAANSLEEQTYCANNVVDIVKVLEQYFHGLKIYLMTERAGPLAGSSVLLASAWTEASRSASSDALLDCFA